MSYFQKAFLELYEPEMTSLGFSRKRYVFHRLVSGKIVQRLSYVMFSGQKEFTIQFGFEPLCCSGEIEVFMDGARLGDLLGNETLGFKNPNSPDDLRETLEMCRRHLFGYFDSVVDYRSYLDFEREQNIKRLSSYNEIQRKRSDNLYIDGLFTQSSYVYAISLINGDYELAKKSREALIKQNIGAHLNNWGVETHPIPERQREFEDMCDRYSRMKIAMDANDRAYIDEYIANKEKLALESYIRNFYGKKAFEKYQNSGELPQPFANADVESE
jgi:hypothetical protein